MVVTTLCEGKYNSAELTFWLPGTIKSYMCMSSNFTQNASASHFLLGTFLSLTLTLLDLLPAALADDGFVL